MTTQEARELLGVAPDASPDDIRRRYAELYAEFQVRLTNAPTAALQKLYRDRLASLPEAQAALLGGGASTPSYGELPSIAPVAVDGSKPLSQPQPPEKPGRSISASKPGGSKSIATAVDRPKVAPGLVVGLAVLVVVAAGGWWLNGQARQRSEAQAKEAERREDERVWASLQSLLDAGNYSDAAAAATAQGRPTVVVRIREACIAEAEIGHLERASCP
jgi:hypothetical protein